MLLPHTPSSVAAARQHLCGDLRSAGVRPGTVDDAALVLSELLSNALRHARPLPSGEIRVSWHCGSGMVELSVSDGGAATEPKLARPGLSALGGRGLGIVEHLAQRWGVRAEEGVNTVWAILMAPVAGLAVTPAGEGTVTPLGEELDEEFVAPKRETSPSRG
ncbi:ATP-binding protein [Allonocardiopsis opalescens]|uniref:ATP-binding protein n=1 Tax=Allonocardiopsis opalescens TaxID=1144618 RepID=UPI003183CFE5